MTLIYMVKGVRRDAFAQNDSDFTDILFKYILSDMQNIVNIHAKFYIFKAH